jgi:hypothetical protein
MRRRAPAHKLVHILPPRCARTATAVFHPVVEFGDQNLVSLGKQRRENTCDMVNTRIAFGAEDAESITAIGRNVLQWSEDRYHQRSRGEF